MTDMRAEVIRPQDLGADLIGLWRQFQAADERLSSPFFAPEFALAVGEARDDARVAVLEVDAKVQGFFPFHRCAGGVAKPIGGQISDYQGVIHAPSLQFDGRALLRACKLNAYDFNHAPLMQAALREGACRFSASPYMDLQDGYEAYAANRPKSWREAMREVRRRTRKIEEEIGPLRFEYHERSDTAYDAHVVMRNNLYRRMNVKSLLGCGSWVDATLSVLRTTQTPHFAGVMSALYAGDRLVAAHFGLRSQTIWHWWFNSYDTDLYKYGPGILLILGAARSAGGQGLSKVDFGRGEAHYKLTFANGGTDLCEGSIEAPASVSGFARSAHKASVKALKRLPLGRYDDLMQRAAARVLTGGVRLA